MMDAKARGARYRATAKSHFAAAARVHRAMPRLIPGIVAVAQWIGEALMAGNKVLFFGNGGSAADASHLAAEFVGRFAEPRRPLPALALTADSAVLTALANDYGYEHVFERQVEAHARHEDVAIGLTTGGSKNVILGLKAAASLAARPVLLTGRACDPSMYQPASDFTYGRVIVAPATVTARVQEAHMLIGHVLCDIVDDIVCNHG